MEKVMAVYDVDPVYARRFADVVNQKEKIPFEVIPFTTLENLKEYAAKHGVEILLVSDSAERADGRNTGKFHSGIGGGRGGKFF